jgi:hypothetical protein
MEHAWVDYLMYATAELAVAVESTLARSAGWRTSVTAYVFPSSTPLLGRGVSASACVHARRPSFR